MWIIIQVGAYALLSGLGAICAEATESKMGQHMGMAVLLLLFGSMGGGWVQGLLLQGVEGWLATVAGIILTVLINGGIAFLLSFFIYAVNSRQALIIGAFVGVGIVLVNFFFQWAMTPVPA